MTQMEKYPGEAPWRDWQPFLDALPLKDSDHILDAGCGPGVVSRLLAGRVARVTAIDADPKQIRQARKHNQASNLIFRTTDYFQPDDLPGGPFDGIWCSFAAAYHPDLVPVLVRWKSLLKPGGWIALVETENLFGHAPLREETTRIFREYASRQLLRNVYDFTMGLRLNHLLEEAGLTVTISRHFNDPELAFDGPASAEILRSWKNRFDRMTAFRDYLGTDLFDRIRNEFLQCLENPDHKSSARIILSIAR